MYDMTAAHPTLPLGSYVRVTNLHNGRAVVVKVNDRGPIVPGRIIDLSYGAAQVLEFEQRGLQTVASTW
jgi:rare lipoprotein A